MIQWFQCFGTYDSLLTILATKQWWAAQLLLHWKLYSYSHLLFMDASPLQFVVWFHQYRHKSDTGLAVKGLAMLSQASPGMREVFTTLLTLRILAGPTLAVLKLCYVTLLLSYLFKPHLLWLQLQMRTWPFSATVVKIGWSVTLPLNTVQRMQMQVGKGNRRK